MSKYAFRALRRSRYTKGLEEDYRELYQSEELCRQVPVHVEKHLAEKATATPQKMTYTILRLVTFFENLTTDIHGKGFCLYVGTDGR